MPKSRLHGLFVNAAEGGEELTFKVKKSTKMSKIMNAYAERLGQQVGGLRFLHNGKKVNPDETVKMVSD